MGGARALAAWEEPGFSPGTDAQRRLPVFAGMPDWQAELKLRDERLPSILAYKKCKIS